MPGNLDFGIFLHEVLENSTHKRKGSVFTVQNPSSNRHFNIVLKSASGGNALKIFYMVYGSKNKDAKGYLAPCGNSRVFGNRNSHGSFTLIGKADRMDIYQKHLTIIDYKTGTIPSYKDLEEVLPQLPLKQ